MSFIAKWAEPLANLIQIAYHFSTSFATTIISFFMTTALSSCFTQLALHPQPTSAGHNHLRSFPFCWPWFRLIFSYFTLLFWARLLQIWPNLALRIDWSCKSNLFLALLNSQDLRWFKAIDRRKVARKVLPWDWSAVDWSKNTVFLKNKCEHLQERCYRSQILQLENLICCKLCKKQ